MTSHRRKRNCARLGQAGSSSEAPAGAGPHQGAGRDAGAQLFGLAAPGPPGLGLGQGTPALLLLLQPVIVVHGPAAWLQLATRRGATLAFGAQHAIRSRPGRYELWADSSTPGAALAAPSRLTAVWQQLVAQEGVQVRGSTGCTQQGEHCPPAGRLRRRSSPRSPARSCMQKQSAGVHACTGAVPQRCTCTWGCR